MWRDYRKLIVSFELLKLFPDVYSYGGNFYFTNISWPCFDTYFKRDHIPYSKPTHESKQGSNRHGYPHPSLGLILPGTPSVSVIMLGLKSQSLVRVSFVVLVTDGITEQFPRQSYPEALKQKTRDGRGRWYGICCRVRSAAGGLGLLVYTGILIGQVGNNMSAVIIS